MFDKNFYPTQATTIIKMIHALPKPITEYNTIIDPSAGKGDILNYIRDNNKYHDFDFYAVEKVPELCEILNGDRFPVIGNDFLTLNTDLIFDLIIMNPPFDHGVKHLLKAWEIAKNTDIVCLLNAETINNPYSQERKLLAKIIEDNNGKIKNLGRCFVDAERSTCVDVVMIVLSKKIESQQFDFSFESENMEEEKINFSELATTCTGIEKADPLGSILDRYEKAKAAYVEYIEAREKVKYYANTITAKHSNIDELMNQAFKDGKTREQKFNKFNTSLKKQVWSHILSYLKLDKFMTSRLQRDFCQFKKDNGNLSLTRENIKAVFQMIVGNTNTILEKCVQDVFDIFTKYHDENRCHVEGWKTNEAWKVNKKIILPNGVSYGSYMSAYDLRICGDKFSINWNIKEDYRDIDKAMCFLSGKKYEDINTIENSLEDWFSVLGNVKAGSFDNECESEFFNIKFYKKGTIHLVFKSEALWAKFNQTACAGRNWLPTKKNKEKAA